MEDFISYLLTEYQLSTTAICHKVNFTHSTKNKIDKLTKRPIINNIISVKIECFDKDHKLILSKNEKFVDGEIQRTKNNKLVNISPDELNNKFSFAKSSICGIIKNELEQKRNDLINKIDDLNSYCGNANTVIPQEFINEPKVAPAVVTENKKNFEF